MSLSSFKTRIRWSVSDFKLVIGELLLDLGTYYLSLYTLLLVLGAIRRFRRRMKSIWLPKPKGRPPVTEVVVDLVLGMKRCNWAWGGQRISDELRHMGIKVSKRTVLKIRFDPLLREFGVTAIPIPYRAPWFNGHVERFHRSEKEEIQFRVRVATADHAGRLCPEYTNFYNQLRPHQGIAGRTPTGQSSPTKHRAKEADLRVRKTKHAFGLIAHFSLSA